MGKYRDIERIIETSVLGYTNLNIVPRGTPIYPDILLTGSMRFGRRSGSNFSTLNPDNQISLTADAAINDYTLNVSRLPKDSADYLIQSDPNYLDASTFLQGCLVTFNGIEMLEISDYDTKNLTITLKDPLATARTAGSKLSLWASPVIVHIDAAAETNVLNVRSKYIMVNGDAIVVRVGPSLSSLKEISVVLAETAGSYPDPEYPYLYKLTLAEGLPFSLSESQRIYIRAFPAYISKPIRITKFASWQLGPFLVDYVASPLDSSATSIPATFGIRTVNAGGTVIEGTSAAFKTVPQNYPIVQRPIWAENLLFWKIIRGSGGFSSPNKYELICNEVGKARVSTPIVPSIPSGQGWTVKVKSASAGLIRIIADPSTFQTYHIQRHTPQVLTLTTPVGGEPITKLEILANMEDPNAKIYISDANPIGATVASVQYSYVFRVVGEANFQATSLVLKPYFLSLSSLSGKYDTGEEYNGGIIYR